MQEFQTVRKAMEKKEARIKCSGCGSSYKVKIPVTDKPVSFKCKKCGKVLKLRIKSVSPEADAPPAPSFQTTMESEPEFERTQLPDSDAYDDRAQGSSVSAPTLEPHFFGQAAEQPPSAQPPSAQDKSRRWIVLSGDIVKGPFIDDEIVTMIGDGDITAETSLRMGERPWIKAAEIANFRDLFPEMRRESKKGPLESMTLIDTTDAAEEGKPSGPPFYEELPAIIQYPVSGGGWQALAIFAGIAFVLCAALSFEFLVGLPVSLIGWIILYGYLGTLMQLSSQSPASPPPNWNFGAAKEMAAQGGKILLVVVVCSLLPVGILVLGMIACFLNSAPLVGYILMALIVLVYAASLFLVPAALVVLGSSQNVATAFSPGKIIALVKMGGQSYRALALVSLAAGLICMLTVVLAMFLAEIPDVGFLVSGLVMALVLSYGHFVWFHVLGRFAGENGKLTRQLLSPGAP
jgi:predicted RNA-binding Zn-ribbon protein involved in translation (DUF1610 family)